MDKQIEWLFNTRTLILGTVQSLDDEQLLIIPEGFNNNILWNLGHIIISQQLITYKCCGLEVPSGEHRIAWYKNGSSPQTWSEETTSDVAWVHQELRASAEQFAADAKAGAFENYQGFKLGPQAEVASVLDGMMFNAFHEGFHMGTIRAYKKLLAGV